jgi:hypothetical protein
MSWLTSVWGELTLNNKLNPAKTSLNRSGANSSVVDVLLTPFLLGIGHTTTNMQAANVPSDFRALVSVAELVAAAI